MSATTLQNKTLAPPYPTSQDNRLLARLLHLEILPQPEGNLDEKLQQLATMAAKVCHGANCALLLCGEDENKNPSPGICATHGDLPASAYQESARAAKVFLTHMLERGEPLLLGKDWSKLPVNTVSEAHAVTLLAPIQIDGKTIGMINVNSPLEKPAFEHEDASLLSVVALFIGKSIQVCQLQNVLNSRFAQIALAHDAGQAIGNVLVSSAQNPDLMSRIVAKSFYRELSKAGFGPSQIISTATEIISQLSASLGKHSKRMTRS